MMVRALAAACLLGAPRVTPPSLPALPSIAHVAIEARGNVIVITEDVSLPRGTWRDDPLDFHVAFGAPGVPRAVDAHLLPVADGELEPHLEATGEVLPTERVPRRPSHAHSLLGRAQMAGVVVHVSPYAFARALAPGGMAALRIRSAVEVPEAPDGVRRVLVRLGAVGDRPLVLGRITIRQDGKRMPVATLCGPDADKRPLAFTPRPPGAPAGLAPVLAVRRPTDDLCVEL